VAVVAIPWFDTPDESLWHIGGIARDKCLQDFFAPPVVGAEKRFVGSRIVFNATVNLAAGGRVLVEQDHFGASGTGLRRCRHACRSRADNGKVVKRVERINIRNSLEHGDHGSTRRAPVCEEMTIPSTTGVIQAWRF